MRIATSLIIASMVGSTAVGALTRYMNGASDQDTRQTLKTLFDKDRSAALRLLEQTASTCVPELAQLKSNNARRFFPRMLLARLDMSETNGDALTKENKELIDKEIRQLIATIPESDTTVLVAAADRMKKEKKKIQTCVAATLHALARKEQKKQSLLSDVELRGS